MVNTSFTTPPSRFTAGQETTVRPLPAQSGELYCTMTFTLFAEFVKSGCRSGEILELLANALQANTSARHNRANSEIGMTHLGGYTLPESLRKQRLGSPFVTIRPQHLAFISFCQLILLLISRRSKPYFVSVLPTLWFIPKARALEYCDYWWFTC